MAIEGKIAGLMDGSGQKPGKVAAILRLFVCQWGETAYYWLWYFKTVSFRIPD